RHEPSNRLANRGWFLAGEAPRHVLPVQVVADCVSKPRLATDLFHRTTHGSHVERIRPDPMLVQEPIPLFRREPVALRVSFTMAVDAIEPWTRPFRHLA